MNSRFVSLALRCIAAGVLWDEYTTLDKISFAKSVFEAFTLDEISRCLSLLSRDDDLCGVVEFLKEFII